MDTFTISLLIGAVSVLLAVVAIWYSHQAERKSADNYIRTKDVLAEIDKKAAVIQATVDTTQQKLVDTITEIARPPRDTSDVEGMKMILPLLEKNPDAFQQIIAMSIGKPQQVERKG